MGKRSVILKSGAVALSILMMSNPLTIYAGSWNYKGRLAVSDNIEKI